MNEHRPVLLEEAVAGLNIQPNGFYIDTTFGRGGHSKKILDSLGPDGRLMAIDKDPSAIAISQKGPFTDDHRFSIEHGSFDQLKEWVEKRDWMGKVNGILFDLGVSSPQLDDPERGFSFTREGPLDMRMNTEQSMDAATWINKAPEKEIADVLWEYGEERDSRRIARAIVHDRVETPFRTTKQLAELIARVSRSREKKHPATRSFQAIRIFINRELEDLKTCLQQCVDVLSVGGRICVISFHSLEDRIVKQFFRRAAQGETYPSALPVRECDIHRTLKKIGRLVRPSEDEVNANPRARSALLRIAEKIV